MSANAVVFPFDVFGSAGTGAGAQLLGDAVREIMDDTEEETRPTRADALRGKLTIQETAFETLSQVREWRTRGRQLAQQYLERNEFTLWLAGNHLGVLPVFEELGPESLVISFDAHLDIHDFHDTTKELSHGNFLRHAKPTWPRFVNVGHRDLLTLSSEVQATFAAAHSAERMATNLDEVLKSLVDAASSPQRIWIDLDCDAIDPAFLPAVQHPLPLGLDPGVLVRLIAAVWSPRVAGVSISEFDPGRDVRDTSLNLLGWLIEWLLLKRLS